MLISPVSCQRLTHSGKDEVLCLNAFGRKKKFKCKIKGFSFIKHFVSFLAECSVKRSASPPRSSPPTATVQIPGGWYLAGLSQVDRHHRWSGGSSTSLRISAPSPPLQCQWKHTCLNITESSIDQDTTPTQRGSARVVLTFSFPSRIIFIFPDPISLDLFCSFYKRNTFFYSIKAEKYWCNITIMIIIIPCLSVKWPFLFTVILELSMGPGGSGKRKEKGN